MLSRAGARAARRCAAERLPGSRGAGAGDRKSTHLNQLRHFASLLFRFRRVLLLHHAQPRYRQLELHLELVLSFISLVVPRSLALQTYDEGLCRRHLCCRLSKVRELRSMAGKVYVAVCSRQLLWSLEGGCGRAWRGWRGAVPLAVVFEHSRGHQLYSTPSNHFLVWKARQAKARQEKGREGKGNCLP